MNLNDYLNDALGKKDGGKKESGGKFRFIEKELRDLNIDLNDQTCLLRVSSEDQLFHYVRVWLIGEGNSNSFEVKLNPTAVEKFWEKDVKTNQPKTSFVAGRGVHKFQFNKVDFTCVIRTVGKVVGTGRGPMQQEEMVIMCGLKDQLILHEFVEYIYEISRKNNTDNIQIFLWNTRSVFWELISTRAKRPMESVILQKKIKDMILEDISDFYSKDAAKFYFDHGIPYKRSILLSGPPGTGKTSFITAIASQFGLNVAFLQPAEAGITDAGFAKSMTRVPKNSVMVLEDVDALFDAGRKKTADASALTFSGMLNVLDGLTSPCGQLFILTTNHPEKLDPAMLRDGRCDIKAFLGHASAEQFKNMYLSYYPSEKDADEFVDCLTPLIGKVSMAKLQAFFVKNRKRTSIEALANLGEWVDKLHQDILDELQAEEDAKKATAEQQNQTKLEAATAAEESSKKMKALSLSRSH